MCSSDLGGVIDRDDQPWCLELFAILLVPEAHHVSEGPENLQQGVSALDLGLILVPHLHDAGVHRSLVRQDAAVAVEPDAQGTALVSQGAIDRIKQCVLLKAPGAKYASASCEHCGSSSREAVEPQLDFAFERDGRYSLVIVTNCS